MFLSVQNRTIDEIDLWALMTDDTPIDILKTTKFMLLTENLRCTFLLKSVS
jgi:hypothetical protein